MCGEHIVHSNLESVLDPALFSDFKLFGPFLHPVELVHLEFESCHLPGEDFLGLGFRWLLDCDLGLTQHALAEIVCEFDFLLEIPVLACLGRLDSLGHGEATPGLGFGLGHPVDEAA